MALSFLPVIKSNQLTAARVAKQEETARNGSLFFCAIDQQNDHALTLILKKPIRHGTHRLTAIRQPLT